MNPNHNARTDYDLCIIGGGINGVGIALAAAHQGLSVCLCEAGDLAQGTSSASSKLIHGGLRYLEYYEFRLVREALAEREVLLKNAPHLIKPMTFVIPHANSTRPAWMIRCGLFLYDILGKRKYLPRSKSISLAQHIFGAPLRNHYKKGFSYSDCWVDDSRLVIACAKSAEAKGAHIGTHLAVTHAIQENKRWQITCLNTQTQETITLKAKALVNASGPWLNELAPRIEKHPSTPITLIKGSHIVIPSLYEGDQAYLLQNKDGRIIFTLPFEKEFTLIGTTDMPYKGHPGAASISEEEILYLCDCVNHYFQKNIKPSHCIWQFAGVRPLQHDENVDPKAITRDYHLDISSSQHTCPLLVVYGGKITTYRRLAEHALALLRPFFNIDPSKSTEHLPLYGAFSHCHEQHQFLASLQKHYPWCDQALLARCARTYGETTHVFLKNKTGMADLGIHFGATLYAAEVDYLVQHEWAISCDDILWRRSKLGLLNIDQEKLNHYLSQADHK